MKSSSCMRAFSVSLAIVCLFLSPNSNLAINIRGWLYWFLSSLSLFKLFFLVYRAKMSLQSQQVSSFSSSVPPASTKWAPDSWRKLPIKQPPNYLDQVTYSWTVVSCSIHKNVYILILICFLQHAQHKANISQYSTLFHIDQIKCHS